MCDGNSQSPMTLRANSLAIAFANRSWVPDADLLSQLVDPGADISDIAGRRWNGVVVARKSHERAHLRQDFSTEQKELVKQLIVGAINDSRNVVFDWQPNDEHAISWIDGDDVLSITFKAPSAAHSHTSRA
jgi:hypothetical protein